MRLEVRKYLYDIKQAADLLGEFTSGKTFSAYTENSMLRAAVERSVGQESVSLVLVGENPQGVVSKQQEEKVQVYFSAIDGLKQLYKSKILPVEDMYKFGNLNSPSLSLVK